MARSEAHFEVYLLPPKVHHSSRKVDMLVPHKIILFSATRDNDVQILLFSKDTLMCVIADGD